MREAVLEILESELTEGILEKKPEAIRRFVRALYEEFARAEEVNERLIPIEEEIKHLAENHEARLRADGEKVRTDRQALRGHE